MKKKFIFDKSFYKKYEFWIGIVMFSFIGSVLDSDFMI